MIGTLSEWQLGNGLDCLRIGASRTCSICNLHQPNPSIPSGNGYKVQTLYVLLIHAMWHVHVCSIGAIWLYIQIAP